MSIGGLNLRESDIKRAVGDYLAYQQNLGRLIYFRLNAGSFILQNPDGSHRRRVQGSPKGTADYLVLQGGDVQTQHLGQLKGEPHPICFVTFIEVKSTKGKQQLDQKAFEVKVNKHNCRYYIVRSVDELEEALIRP